jgi:UDP-sulfoquinovose synthase
VLNRFLVEAAVGHPLTVHGSGGQTRAFIHIRDSVRCIRMAVESGDAVTDRVRVMNQMTETHRIADLAHVVADEFGAQIDTVVNPRLEADANELSVRNDSLRLLGLDPIPLNSRLLGDEYDLAVRYADRVDPERIPCRSYWNEARRTAADAGRS